MTVRIVEPLSIAESDGEGGTLLTVKGRITIDSSPTFRDRLLVILGGSQSALTLDLSAVPYIDCSGLATLVEALKIARATKTMLRLRLHDRPRYLLEVTGLLTLFDARRDASAGTIAKDI
jgi:anti-sigma B factor antagonist